MGSYYSSIIGRIVAYHIAPNVSAIPLSEKPPATLPGPGTTQTAAVVVKSSQLDDKALTSWDPWPNGHFERTLSNDEYTASNCALVHWATRNRGGYTGNAAASSWHEGKKGIRSCLGVITCNNQDCNARIRPPVRPKALEKRLQESCPICGSGVLHHNTCDVKIITHTFRGGRHIEHQGYHFHDRPIPIHLTVSEKAELAETVSEHPKVGPAMLMTGVPKLHGHTKPVTEISPTLLNADRVKYEVGKIRKPSQISGSEFLRYAQFCADHPNFVINSHVSDCIVLSMQSSVLAGQFVKEIIPDEAINGIVSDAAHGYWLDKNSLLIISSTYSPILECWVPGVFSWSNGASAEHYEHHFYALMKVIESECHRRDLGLTDDYFANVSSLSQ